MTYLMNLIAVLLVLLCAAPPVLAQPDERIDARRQGREGKQGARQENQVRQSHRSSCVGSCQCIE